MRKLLRMLPIMALAFSSSALFAADLQKGLAAFDVGDYETALAECLPLADEGNVEAQFCVGRLYANGFGVPMDDEQALKYYGLAAAGGHAEAQFNLGVMHANGWGVEMNDVPAAGFYRLAAEQGFAPAQAALGFSYKHGAGVEKDVVAAYTWFDIAAQRGDLTAAQERDDLAESMSEEEVMAGQRSALQWLESYEGSAMHAGRLE
ncbi:MAG: sel1 repeat family protein [Gammaproteobacteria bacterium]|nr:sel1 repeat family protein [Gammaproteobacteria bacterium]